MGATLEESLGALRKMTALTESDPAWGPPKARDTATIARAFEPHGEYRISIAPDHDGVARGYRVRYRGVNATDKRKFYHFLNRLGGTPDELGQGRNHPTIDSALEAVRRHHEKKCAQS